VLPRFGASLHRVGIVDASHPATAVALHAQHRVHHQLDHEARLVHHHRQRVDQERHVVGDEFDPGVRRIPAVLRQRRVEGADPRLAGLAGRAESQVTCRCRGERAGLPGAQVVFIDAAIVGLHEVADRDRRLAAAQRAGPLGDVVDEVLPRSRNGAWHGVLPVSRFVAKR
jgi:hypothetical protein